MDATIACDLTNGRLISFIESHTRVHNRHFDDGRVRFSAIMGKQTLSDLSRNDQVEVLSVDEVELH